jgi:hypothetical protein
MKCCLLVKGYTYGGTAEIWDYQYAGARRPGQDRDKHLRIYRGIPATRGDKEHFMYAVTVETPRSGQASHAHLSSYRGNLKNVYACVLQNSSGARSYRENPNNVYVCILYCRISARRTST